ncbi:MAG: diacylglycerol/lipid kinase family protein [Planctomycetota bacterium]|jgi:YegS/Rv2252/BmrU family lipid kinase
MHKTSQVPERARVRILANPVSGLGRAEGLAEETARILQARGAQAEVFFTRQFGDAQREALRSVEEWDVVVAVGGDGTVNEVANGITGTGMPLGLVPTGTANLLAKEFGITPVPERVAETILAGRTLDLDAGRWRDRLFLGVLGVGFDAAVASAYAGRRRGTGSYRAYVTPLLHALARAPFPTLRITTEDGSTFFSRGWVLVTNTRSYGGPFEFCHDADPGDGALDAVLIRRGGASGILRYMALSVLRRFPQAADTRRLRGRCFTIQPEDGEVPLQLDGDVAGTCSVDEAARIEVVPAAVRLLVPAGGGR